ncbi:1,4-dihydroxy-2-naphthoate octaprenyltransferase [Halolamina pelagica]|uniref:1,4-dihydroxy-2-naphthoate octaprenyltransferase n=1 Tax=Halolamina pelagica TaxID=699431 RepID=A0A0P7G8P3_9EURY|nr:1,4-dihydroxy-2-naphthoate octaprenyltransferase [Halolamina pelagica]
MAIARHGSGPTALASAYGSQVHPVFMLPPVATALFGAALAGAFDSRVALVAAGAAFFAVYTAHLKDGYVDFHRRGEDDDHPLTVLGCRLGLAVATAGFLACLAVLGWLTGPPVVALAAPMWAIGYLHAPQFDTNPVTTTLGYPVGIGLCLLTGYAAQTGSLATRPLALAAVLVTVLAGVKIIDDAQDYDYDRSIGKRTVAVVLGPTDSRSLAIGLLAAGLFAVVPLTITGVMPSSAPVASLAFGAVAAVAVRREPTTATMLLVRGRTSSSRSSWSRCSSNHWRASRCRTSPCWARTRISRPRSCSAPRRSRCCSGRVTGRFGEPPERSRRSTPSRTSGTGTRSKSACSRFRCGPASNCWGSH